MTEYGEMLLYKCPKRTDANERKDSEPAERTPPDGQICKNLSRVCTTAKRESRQKIHSLLLFAMPRATRHPAESRAGNSS